MNILNTLSITMSNPFYPALRRYIEGLERETEAIPSERRLKLYELAASIRRQFTKKGEAYVTVICTHNSRRSHLGQLWLDVCAKYLNKTNLYSYSGGTKETALNLNIIHALHRVGCVLSNDGVAHNPRYTAHLGPRQTSGPLFSKEYTHTFNPQKEFTAVMVCSEAAKACPFVPEALDTITLPYHDPKTFDGTAKVHSAYDACCLQVATEMFYVVSKL